MEMQKFKRNIIWKISIILKFLQNLLNCLAINLHLIKIMKLIIHKIQPTTTKPMIPLLLLDGQNLTRKKLIKTKLYKNFKIMQISMKILGNFKNNKTYNRMITQTLQ